MKTTYRYAKVNLHILIFLILSSAQLTAQTGNIPETNVLGHGFDIRYVDALNWEASSKGRSLFEAAVSTSNITTSSEETYHFITTPYEFERELLQTTINDRPYLAINTKANYRPLKDDGGDKLLFVYTYRKQPLQRKFFSNNTKQLDSAFVEDFRRLGRDITTAGFIERYGTHYAHEIVEGGVFLQRYSIPVDDYIYSPYNKDEFKNKVIEDIITRNHKDDDSTPFINAHKGTLFSVGGNEEANLSIEWLPTVKNNIKPIEVEIRKISTLLKSANITDIDHKIVKTNLLDSIIENALSTTQDRIKEAQRGSYYKKYSLQFNQEITSIVKKSTGREGTDKTTYTGDIFFGGFSKDEASLKTSPLIETGGLRLETLITDEKINLDRSVLITIKPEDIKQGYVSVWDDTKKLVKGNGRTRLRVSGPAEARTTYEEALRQVVTKDVTIKTIDEDLYEISYQLSLVKPQGIIQNFAAQYNYILDSEILAAVSNGNTKRLDSLFTQNGNPRADGIIESIIINKHSNELLNYVLDKGAIPKTEDLDILFIPENFDETKALILLERGAQPKNNMIYKAVAYQSAPVIYALLREGATSQNNDLAFAIKGKHYPTIKALMSSDYDIFTASSNELLLAVANNDKDLAKKFVELDAKADASILEVALKQKNLELESIILPVTEPSGSTLEVVAQDNNAPLFSYFIERNAKLSTNKAVEISVDNNNMKILDLALKNGGDPTKALQYGIIKENKDAIETSLRNQASPDAVFAYATAKNDEQLFNDALNIYGGTPASALDEAVKRNVLPMAATVLKTKSQSINPSESLSIAVSNNNLEMVSLLVDNKADPTFGIQRAIDVESIPITKYLISQGAKTAEPQYLQNAVKSNNLALSKVLIENGDARANNAIIEAALEGNIEITQYLLNNGASADKALAEAMQTKNEDLILLLMDKATEVLDPSYMYAAARKGNKRVVKKLIESGSINPNIAIGNAIRYKKIDILNMLLENNGVPTEDEFKAAIEFNFYEGINSLLNKGLFNANTPFKNGNYPIHIVAISYETIDEKILTLLLENGANIDAQNNYGDTALHLAASVNQDEINIIQLLLDNNANTQITNKKGRIPLDNAIHKPIKSLLKKAARKR